LSVAVSAERLDGADRQNDASSGPPSLRFNKYQPLSADALKGLGDSKLPSIKVDVVPGQAE